MNRSQRVIVALFVTFLPAAVVKLAAPVVNAQGRPAFTGMWTRIGPSLRQGATDQRRGPLADFLITIETSLTEVTLTCQHGCEWGALTFPVASTPTWVDSQGIVSDKREALNREDGYLLGVGADDGVKDDGLNLRCERGCWYQSYAFTPRNVPWLIDSCIPMPKKLWKATDMAIPCAERHAAR